MAYRAWVSSEVGGRFEKHSLDRPPLGAEEVEVAVDHCGICHSDLSMWHNDWGMTKWPAVFGHEVVGRVTDMGPQAKGLTVVAEPFGPQGCRNSWRVPLGIPTRGPSI